MWLHPIRCPKQRDQGTDRFHRYSPLGDRVPQQAYKPLPPRVMLKERVHPAAFWDLQSHKPAAANPAGHDGL